MNEYKNAFKGVWVGVSWGLGHTLPLLILGTVILVFKDLVMDSYEEIAPVFEFGVGVMLVFLGATKKMRDVQDMYFKGIKPKDIIY